MPLTGKQERYPNLPSSSAIPRRRLPCRSPAHNHTVLRDNKLSERARRIISSDLDLDCDHPTLDFFLLKLTLHVLRLTQRARARLTPLLDLRTQLHSTQSPHT